MNQLGIIVLSIFIFVSCTQKAVEGSQSEEKEQIVLVPEGKTLMKSRCYSCHNPNVSHSNTIAPPLVGMKMRYLRTYPNRADFVNAVVQFAQNPSKENAILRGAVRNYGLMPKAVYNEEEIKKIAEYIYDYQIAVPEWFSEHYKDKFGEKFNQPGKNIDESTTENASKSTTELGKEIALSTKKVLGGNLMKAIQEKGAEGALTFCNVKAIPLTDSMSTAHQVAIKRISDKARNPDNKASKEELKIIDDFKNQLVQNGEIKPTNKGENYYYPILTNSMCLQCHGTKETISTEVQTKLKKLYPNDQAIGYDVNQLRGIWRITMVD